MVPQLLIRQAGLSALITVGGSIDASVANGFALALAQDVRTLSGGASSVDLDFRDLELDDGASVAEAVNALRAILVHAAVVVHHAPQMLAHTLYKTGMLRGARLALSSPRDEEPTAG